MGNRVRADITIGGRLNACCVEAFLDALADDCVSARGLGPDGEDLDPPDTAEGLAGLLLLAAEQDRKAGVDRRGLTLGGDEINYGNLDTLKHFCTRRGLPFHYDCADGNGEFDGEDEWHDPVRGSAVLYSFAADGHAVTLNDLRNAWKDHTGAEIAAWFDQRMVEPGPLEVVPAAAACPGCLADALLPGAAQPEDFAGPALDSPEAAG